MKSARSAKRAMRPRNPFAGSPLMAKAGAHERQDKKAGRARQKVLIERRLRKEGNE
ncbi:MAG: hypothetical protein H6943_04400 [Zoogloeaceae bacterium]|nr:hypothetical protein [Zoogloeaceae bacterium]